MALSVPCLLSLLIDFIRRCSSEGIVLQGVLEKMFLLEKQTFLNDESYNLISLWYRNIV